MTDDAVARLREAIARIVRRDELLDLMDADMAAAAAARRLMTYGQSIYWAEYEHIRDMAIEDGSLLAHEAESLLAALAAATQRERALTPLARLGLWALKNGLSVPGTSEWYTEYAVAMEAERLGIGSHKGAVTYFDGMPEGVEWFEESPATVAARALLAPATPEKEAT